jgi:hypothetical protein
MKWSRFVRVMVGRSRDNRCHATLQHHYDELRASGFGGGFFVYG